jgi:hypothetical protein
MHNSNHPTIHSPSSDPVINRVGSCSLIHAKEVMRVPGRLQFENLDNFFPDLNKSTGKRKRKSVSLDPTRQLYSHKKKIGLDQCTTVTPRLCFLSRIASGSDEYHQHVSYIAM